MQGKRRNRASTTSHCSAVAAAAGGKERSSSSSSSTTKPNDSTHGKAKTANASAHISHTLKTSRGINKCIQGQGGTYELKQPLENALTQSQAHGLASFHTIALNAAAAPTSTAQDATQLNPPAAASLGQSNVLQALLIAAAQAQSQNSSTSNANPSPHIHAAALQMAPLQNNDQFLAGLINNVAQTHGIQAAIQLFSQLALLNTNTTSLSNEVVLNLENSNAVFPQAQANLMPPAQQSVQNQLDMLLEQIQQQNREQERQRQLQLLSQLLEQELKKQLDRK